MLRMVPSRCCSDVGRPISVGPWMICGVGDDDRIWSGAVWRPPPGKRGALLHEALYERRTACIRRLGGCRSREVQFTRFLRNEAVTTGAMVCEAVTRTAPRVAGRDIVVIQDTTELNLGGRLARANGYGPIGKGGAVRGLVLHVGLAVELATGAVIGLADVQVWNRDKGAMTPRHSRATADKESQRWIDNAARAGEMLAAANSITDVSDRESDIYEHFASRPANVDLLVRSHHNRRIETGPDMAGDSPAPVHRWLARAGSVYGEHPRRTGAQGTDGGTGDTLRADQVCADRSLLRATCRKPST